MDITFDPVKNASNIAKHGLSFEQAAEFDYDSAFYWADTRKEYGETRIRALGYLGIRLHALVFVETEQGIRVISFRKANNREVKLYEQATR